MSIGDQVLEATKEPIKIEEEEGEGEEEGNKTTRVITKYTGITSCYKVVVKKRKRCVL